MNPFGNGNYYSSYSTITPRPQFIQQFDQIPAQSHLSYLSAQYTPSLSTIQISSYPTNQIKESENNSSQRTLTLPSEPQIPPIEGYVRRWEQLINMETIAIGANQARKRINSCLLKSPVRGEESGSFIFSVSFPEQKEAYNFSTSMRKKKLRIGLIPACKRNDDTYPLVSGRPYKTTKPTQKRDLDGEFCCFVHIKFIEDFASILEKSNTGETDEWIYEEIKPSFYDTMEENVEALETNEKLSELIVELRKPTFTSATEPITVDSGLNIDQQKALNKALLARDYSIIVGMPGTGKTELIIELLRVLIEGKKNILFCSHTHNAIDNLLDRFKEKYPKYKNKILRIGGRDKAEDHSEGQIKDQAEYQIFAATCLASNNTKLKKRRFDYCVVDEASQALEPVVLGPLLKADRFILFGDHRQLQPIVESKDAIKRGMNISLFERLAIAHQDSVSNLTIQYRMNHEIVRFSNELIYNNQMKFANEGVKSGLLKIANLSEDHPVWMRMTFNPGNPVIFLDIDSIHDRSKTSTDRRLTSWIAKCLIKLGCHSTDVVVITPINTTKNALDNLLRSSGVDVYTLDSCQGITRDCIIIDFTQEFGSIKDLLSDERRINVAFTRAKYKLIMVGSLKKLKTMRAIGSFVSKLNQETEICSLQPGDEEAF